MHLQAGDATNTCLIKTATSGCLICFKSTSEQIPPGQCFWAVMWIGMVKFNTTNSQGS